MHFAQINDQLGKLCVVLAREDEHLFRTVDEVVADARKLLEAGISARQALASGRSPRSAYAKAARIAEAYKARVVEGHDVGGMVLGLRLISARHSSAVCYVA